MLNANYGFYVSFKPLKNPVTASRQMRDAMTSRRADAYDFYLKAKEIRGFDWMTEVQVGRNFLFHDQLVHPRYL